MYNFASQYSACWIESSYILYVAVVQSKLPWQKWCVNNYALHHKHWRLCLFSSTLAGEECIAAVCHFQSAVSLELRREEVYCFILHSCAVSVSPGVWFPAAIHPFWTIADLFLFPCLIRESEQKTWFLDNDVYFNIPHLGVARYNHSLILVPASRSTGCG